jgi:hypothetical protein
MADLALLILTALSSEKIFGITDHRASITVDGVQFIYGEK